MPRRIGGEAVSAETFWFIVGLASGILIGVVGVTALLMLLLGSVLDDVLAMFGQAGKYASKGTPK